MNEIRFGAHVLQPGRQLLRDGQRIPLGRRALGILGVLAENGGAIVTKDEIFDQVWQDAIVEENSLQVHVAALRKALGEDAKLIETIRGVGYKLDALLADTAPKAPPGQEQTLDLPVFQFGGSAAPVDLPRDSIVILPFRNRGGSDDNDFFCDGLVEDITSAVAKMPQLMVIARGTAFEFKRHEASPDVIARALGVTNVLSGSVRRIGNRARVSAILQDAKTGRAIWSKTYDRDLDDIFDVQDELAFEIVTALDVELVHGDFARINRRNYRSAESADELYRGMYVFYTLDYSSILLARQHFERFVEMEPDSALGHMWLAYTWGTALLVQFESPEVALPKFKFHADKALEIDGENPVSLTSNAYASALLGDKLTGLDFAKRAVVNSPNYDEGFFAKGWVEMFLGKTEDAIVSLERAMLLNPIPPTVRLGVLGTAYRNAGRYEDSIRTFSQLIERYPDFQFGYVSLACTCALSGDIDRAKQLVAEMLRREPGFTITRFRTPDLYDDPNVMEECAAALRLAGLPE